MKKIHIKQVKQAEPQYHSYITENKALSDYHKKQKIFNKHIEGFIDYLGVKLEHSDKGHADFEITTDRIRMPFKSKFKRLRGITREQNYYSTLFHELAHWSGHKKRLKRLTLLKYDRDSKEPDVISKHSATEEVTAELTANMLMEFFKLQSSPSYLSLCFINKELSYFNKDEQEKIYIKGLKQATNAVSFFNKQYKKYVKEE